MDIYPIDLLGNSSIGIFSLATNNYAIFPHNISGDTFKLVHNTLKVKVIQTTLNNSNLNGLFAVGNSHHLLLPNLVSDLEFNTISDNISNDVTLSIMDTTLTALGNVIITTDKKAVVSSEFTLEEQKCLEDYLDVEITTRTILNSTIVGSMIFLTSNGMLTHPLISDENLDWLEEYFKLPVDVVTVNRGTPYPRPGIVGNQNGILVGSDTTGPELMRIFDVLSAD